MADKNEELKAKILIRMPMRRCDCCGVPLQRDEKLLCKDCDDLIHMKVDRSVAA